jgi:hypothetical protein
MPFNNLFTLIDHFSFWATKLYCQENGCAPLPHLGLEVFVRRYLVARHGLSYDRASELPLADVVRVLIADLGAHDEDSGGLAVEPDGPARSEDGEELRLSCPEEQARLNAGLAGPAEPAPQPAGNEMPTAAAGARVPGQPAGVPESQAGEAEPGQPRVILGAKGEKAIVLGKARPLTPGHHDIVRVLLDAGKEGLSKDDLIRKSGHGDAVNMLKRLASDPCWTKVVHLPGRPWKRYQVW